MSEENEQLESPKEVMARAQTKALEAAGEASQGSIAAFSSMGAFEAAQRMAKALATSDLVPAQYQGNVANCLVAMELASRTRASVFKVMQSLYIVHGNPAWSAKFLIGSVNASGRFSPLRYEWQGAEDSDSWGCRAVATDLRSGDELRGPLITIDLAKREGWYGKAGSKWQTMPEKMLMYRAGAWWVDLYAPEVSLGMQTAEEAQDWDPADRPDVSGIVASKTDARLDELSQKLNGTKPTEVQAEEVETVTAPDDEPDFEVVEEGPSDFERAKVRYQAAYQTAGLSGDARLDWQEEHIGERSQAKWSTETYVKAAEMLEEGIGLPETVEPESVEVPEDGSLPL